MIDTIRGYKLINNSITYDEKILFHIKNSIKVTYKEWVIYKFNIENFNFSFKFDKENTLKRISFYGSLTKFYFGNNLEHLNIPKLKYTINKLSESVGIDLSDSEITRVDYGYNLRVKLPIYNYLISLYSYPKFDTVRYKDSVYFYKEYSNRKLLFYDKLSEFKKSKNQNLLEYQDILTRLKGKYLLRYEISIKRKMKFMLKKKKVTLKSLAMESTLFRLHEIWYKSYQRVVRLSNSLNYDYILHEHNGVLKYLAIHGINQINYELLINHIENYSDDVKNIRSKRSKMKSVVNSFIREVHLSTLGQTHIKELDNKIDSIRKKVLRELKRFKT